MENNNKLKQWLKYQLAPTIELNGDFGYVYKKLPFKFHYRKMRVGYYYNSNNKLCFNKQKVKVRYTEARDGKGYEAIVIINPSAAKKTGGLNE